MIVIRSLFALALIVGMAWTVATLAQVHDPRIDRLERASERADDRQRESERSTATRLGDIDVKQAVMARDIAEIRTMMRAAGSLLVLIAGRILTDLATFAWAFIRRRMVA